MAALNSKVISNRLYEIDPKLAISFDNAKDQYQWLRDAVPTLEQYSKYTENYEDLQELIGDSYTSLSKFYDKMKGNIPSDERMRVFLNKHPGITKDQIIDWFNKSNYWKEYYKEERERETGKTRRQQEISGKYTNINNPEEAQARNWGTLKRLLTSDYDKQRYIEDPQSAVFGYEAPGFIGSSTGAKADVITGSLAGAADIATAPIPLVNILTGPSIRFARDVAHKVSDSPYQKQWGSLATDYITDIGLNAGAEALANARKLSRIASGLSKPEVKQAFELSLETDGIKKGLQALETPSNTVTFAQQIKQLPESPLKQDLLTTIDDFVNKGVDVERANKIINDYKKFTRQGYQELYEDIATNKLSGNMPRVEGAAKSYLNNILINPELRGYNKLNYNLLRGANAINLGTPGTMIMEALATGKGTRSSKPERVMTDEEYKDFISKKEMFKKLHGEDWINFGRAFAPNKKPGDPAWEAYVEVTGDTGEQ